MALYIVVFFVGVTRGKPWLLVTPFDSDGNGCGHTAGFENHKYIYFYRVRLRIQISNLNFFNSLVH